MDFTTKNKEEMVEYVTRSYIPTSFCIDGDASLLFIEKDDWSDLAVALKECTDVTFRWGYSVAFGVVVMEIEWVGVEMRIVMPFCVEGVPFLESLRLGNSLIVCTAGGCGVRIDAEAIPKDDVLMFLLTDISRN